MTNPLDNDPGRVDAGAPPTPAIQRPDPATLPFEPDYDPRTVPTNDYATHTGGVPVSDCYKQGGSQ
jgi:hypothetical protein